MELDIGSALKAGADSASGMIQQGIKEDAENRAADRKLSDQLRLAAGMEMLKNRAAERFGSSVKVKEGTQVPVTADPVTATTADSGKAIGLDEGLTGDLTKQRELLSRIPDPTQRAEAMAQLDKQTQAQGLINSSAVEGKTRPMTRDEAIKAAQDDNMVNDPAAYVAGKGLTADKYTTLADGASLFDTTTGKLVIANSSKEDRARMQEEGKDRRHAESMDIQSQRLEASLAKIASGSDKVLQHQFLNSMENDIRDAESRIRATEKTKKDLYDPKDLKDANDAIKELTETKNMLRRSKIEFARNSGIQIPDAYKEKPESSTTSNVMAELPSGAKQIGTSGGKPVYEVNGKRFIQN